VLHSVLGTLSIIPSCAGGAEEESSFVAGWVVLAIICVGMAVLFGGILRYLLAGRAKKPPAARAAPTEYRYEDSDEDEESGPGGGPGPGAPGSR
jgi:hypothetical protein